MTGISVLQVTTQHVAGIADTDCQEVGFKYCNLPHAAVAALGRANNTKPL